MRHPRTRRTSGPMAGDGRRVGDCRRARLFDREGKTAEGDLLAKCAANLMRLWCDD